MQATRSVMLMYAFLLMVGGALASLYAQNNETPRSKGAWWIEPYACVGYTSNIMQRVANNQGYNVEYLTNTDIDLDPDVTIPHVEALYGSGAGAGRSQSRRAGVAAQCG